jgi:pyridoxine/pyridoxamine 5'-phosphate oxidase
MQGPRRPERERAGFVAVVFDEATRRLLDDRNFATVATLNPDGGPQTSVVWILREGDTVVFSATAARQKARNLARDARPEPDEVTRLIIRVIPERINTFWG